MPYVFWLFFQSGIFLVVCTIELGAGFSFEVQDFWRVSKSRFTKSSLGYKETECDIWAKRDI